MIQIKSKKEIEIMREGGQILVAVLDILETAVKPGIQTLELEKIAREEISARDAKPSFLNYNGFPAALCVSINEEIVHGLPSKRILKDGDLVKLDLGIFYKGFHTDSARSVVVGSDAHSDLRNLLAVTVEALEIGINAAQVGNTTGDIGHAIHEYVKSHKLDVVRDLIGHGVGKEVHEEPEVPNYGKPGTGAKLVEGMTIAIEPMVVIGSHDIIDGLDGYSYITADKKPAAHFEHTVAICKGGPCILTR